MCRSMVDIRSAAAEIRRGKKKKKIDRKKIEITGQKYNGPLLHRAAMWADAQRDGRPTEYRWHSLRKLSNSIPCITLQSLADGRCSSVVQ